MRRSPRVLLVLLALTLPSLVRAQAAMLFGNGQPPVYEEGKQDRQFPRTRLGRALEAGTDDPNCVQLLGGLLTLLGETAPRLHKRDPYFFLEPVLVDTLRTQLGPNGFPANVYLGEMVRRVLIEGSMPVAWLKVAEQVNQSVHIIDLAKLHYLADGPRLIDSFYLTLPLLVERHRVEVEQANSTVARGAERAFREAYLDHDVTFGGLRLVDIRSSGLAFLEEPPPKSNERAMPFFDPPKPKKGRLLVVRLAKRQYVDLARLPKGARVMVRGRLYDFNPKLSRLELRDGLLFEDRDFSAGAVLADPGAVARCPMARDDLTPNSTLQAGGFGQH